MYGFVRGLALLAIGLGFSAGVLLAQEGRPPIAQEKSACIFAIFHRTADRPLFRIYKEPRLAAKQGAYSVLGQNGRILKRGKTLAQVLKIFDRKKFDTID